MLLLGMGGEQQAHPPVCPQGSSQEGRWPKAGGSLFSQEGPLAARKGSVPTCPFFLGPGDRMSLYASNLTSCVARGSVEY